MTNSPQQQAISGEPGTGPVPAPHEVERIPVDFWFDPVCPWSWLTSRWLLEVVKVRPVEPRWRVMSLAILQANGRLPREYRAMLSEARGPARVCVAVAAEHGDRAVPALYTALGRRFHEQGLPQTREVVEDALHEAGLPAGPAEALHSRTYDAALEASHKAAVDLAGDDIGTPVLGFGGLREGGGGRRAGFFGPVVNPVPRGEEAARLWDGVALLAATPGFYELKRSRP
ncbi:mycothiol-dependent nitroreductase Rv2466c family protein [Streptomyces sp. NBC_01304]|uniref:mycothiol-dependent nitroreductase Rv2466c family protein n=1 Tax=Streptomyces sp. NBC_01304 TaxID=2903818 RepID=UPI002E154E51|nr:DsbA family protein [Streptomyces sp. NBC_01304]